MLSIFFIIFCLADFQPVSENTKLFTFSCKKKIFFLYLTKTDLYFSENIPKLLKASFVFAWTIDHCTEFEKTTHCCNIDGEDN